MSDEIPMIMEREAGAPPGVPMVAVGFGMVPSQSKKKSAVAGYPVFEDREFVKITIPGDKGYLFLQPATELHKQRFPNAYAAFKRRTSDAAVDGMPIEQWPQVTRSTALTLKAMNIHSVEALASVHDGNINKLGNEGRALRAKAQAFLEVAKDSAATQKMADENRKLTEMIEEQQRQIKQLAAKIEQGSSTPPRKKRKRTRRVKPVAAPQATPNEPAHDHN